MKKSLKEWWYVYAIGAFSGLISAIKNRSLNFASARGLGLI